jgi:dihydroorotase
MNQLNITRPDDWHLHLRRGEMMRAVVVMTAKQMRRAIVMPNLSPPIRKVEEALRYRSEIIASLPKQSSFNPLMTLYLTDNTTKQDIIDISHNEHVYAVKLYPAGSTTNSHNGVTDLSGLYPTIEQMQKEKIPLLIHGEVTSPDIDIFDREKVFIETVLDPLLKRFSELKVVLEHITTKDAVDFISDVKQDVAATITAHHLLANRNHMFVGGIQPHHYCLPVLKRRQPHQESLIKAATSGNPRFFLGTDSAPHDRLHKESSCGCAGVFSAHAAIELYAEAFDRANKIEKLEGFASHYGPDFYGLKRNTDMITLEKKSWTVPEKLNFSGAAVVPFFSGEELSWSLVA